MNFDELKIRLVEGMGATLGSMSEKAQKYSERYLRELGVEVHLNKMVESYDGHNLVFTDGEKMETNNVIWAAGGKGVPIPGLPAEARARGNRIRGSRDNKVEGLSDGYGIGDIASMEASKDRTGH